tara:strand:- start:1766 stop:1975 length:210 start_codon:yes stop_codon:yes gene_type:complete
MSDYSKNLINTLYKKIREYPRFSENEIEKYCWMAAHEHKHGVLPSEYDIKDIDEELYLQLLQKFKSNNA